MERTYHGNRRDGRTDPDADGFPDRINGALRGIKSDTGRIATATEQMADDIGSVVAPLGSKVGAKAINVNS